MDYIPRPAAYSEADSEKQFHSYLFSLQLLILEQIAIIQRVIYSAEITDTDALYVDVGSLTLEA